MFQLDREDIRYGIFHSIPLTNCSLLTPYYILCSLWGRGDVDYFLILLLFFYYYFCFPSVCVFTLAVGRCESHLFVLFWINNELINDSKSRYVLFICCNEACWT